MLYFSRWKALAIAAACAIICLMAVPSLLPPTTYAELPGFLQRKIVLGLDLQGGSYIVLQVSADDVRKARLETLRDDARRVLRDARVGYSGLAIQGNAVVVTIRDGQDASAAFTKLRELAQPLGGVMSGNGQLDTDVTASGNTITLAPTSAGVQSRTIQAVTQSIEIIRKRIDQLGTTEPSIQRQGSDRIQVQVPGLQDPSRLKALLGQTAQLSFRMVDSTMSPQQAQQTAPAGRLRSADVAGQSADALPHRAARAGRRAGSGRCAARLRFQHPRAGRQFPLQHQWRAPLRRGDAGQCRPAVRHRAGQPGDLRRR